jgi:hypothetical protein
MMICGGNKAMAPLLSSTKQIENGVVDLQTFMRNARHDKNYSVVLSKEWRPTPEKVYLRKAGEETREKKLKRFHEASTVDRMMA